MDGDEPHLSKLLDLVMLTVTGGRERAAEEYHHLLARPCVAWSLSPVDLASVRYLTLLCIEHLGFEQGEVS